MTPKLPINYKQDFDPNTGKRQKISTLITMETEDRRLVTKSREVRKFNGTSVEELCFTRECFDLAADDISIKNANLKEQFIKILSPKLRTKRNKIIQTENDEGNPIGNTRDEFEWALDFFTDIYAIEKNSKQIMMEAIIQGKGGLYFKDKEEGANIDDHSDWYEKFVCYINKLQGELDQLSEADKTNISFKSFKQHWQDQFHKDQQTDHTAVSWEEICEYMEMMK